MRKIARFACCAAGLVTFSATMADAYAYRRPQDAATPGVPRQSQSPNLQGYSQQVPSPQNQRNFALNGAESATYSYGYALNMPADGNWRWIDARCYSAQTGQVCIDGHWMRRQAGRCEEVSNHSVRQGQYIRMVPSGPVNTCRR